jgi:GT2 family glycosyltransferase
MSFVIVIPSQNANNLVACVGAIRAAGETAHIVIVDDGIDSSLFESDAQLALRPYSIVPGIRPFVFARNVNLGIRVAGDRADIVLMNDDAILHTQNGLTRLAADAAAHPEYGVIAASVDSCGTPNQIHRSAHGIAIERLPQGLREERAMLAFVCVYVPRRTINLVGLLDERFGLQADGTGPRGYGCEDDDYCLRVRQTGLKLGVQNDVFVNHTTLPSTFRHGDRRADVRLHEKLFREKHGHWPEGHGYPTR